MTRDEIAGMLAGVGLPYAYDHFTEAEAPGAPPFICFLYTDGADLPADDCNYQRITGLTVELYTDAPDFAKEAAVETALNGAGLVYGKSGPEYIDGERMYMTTWTTSAVITEPPPAPPATPDAGQDNDNSEVLDTNAEQQGKVWT